MTTPTFGCRLIDQLHLQSYRPQPPGRSQKHARRNYSTLLVLKLERPADHMHGLEDRVWCPDCCPDCQDGDA